MQTHPKTAGMRLRSSFLLFAIVGNLIFSAVFVLSTGVHVVKSGNTMQPSTTVEKEPVKEKMLVLAQIN
ncbi:hypothetical protein ESA94_20215 [Lacibacter luteus]|uniref:Uncharacterized protein n=1 Tax=Lacibacter luteus TaxID=2508719 RepID=A0A4Q1CDT1_9BACT|nr:hypothetical protein [Lacibacter luteus]RXK57847.1 hypothetical protein ESA94_20215 [Lacibacter luteus]